MKPLNCVQNTRYDKNMLSNDIRTCIYIYTQNILRWIKYKPKFLSGGSRVDPHYQISRIPGVNATKIFPNFDA